MYPGSRQKNMVNASILRAAAQNGGYLASARVTDTHVVPTRANSMTGIHTNKPAKEVSPRWA